MLVRVGKRAGFCMGVRRALDKALEAAASRPGRKGRLYTYGPLIHNTQVVDLLRRRRVHIVEEAADLKPGDQVVIRAHGVPPQKLTAIRQAGATVCDATCPHVKRAQETVKKAVAAGARVIIVGDRGHAEVSGLLGYAGGNGTVVENVSEVESLPPMEFAWVVAQTTQAAENFQQVAEAVRKRVPRVEVTKTICGSTSSRQQEVIELAGDVDVMIVVGGKHSANTVRLAELARQTSVPTVHVETAEELDPAYLQQFRVAGVTAGASTPNWIIEEVVEKLRSVGPVYPVWASFRGLFSFLLTSHLFVSGGAVALTYAAFRMAAMRIEGIALNPLIPLLAGLYLFSMQNLNMFLEYRHGEIVPQRRRQLYERFGSFLGPVSAVSAVASMALALALDRWPFLILAFSAVLGGLYTVRILPARWRYQRLKDLPGSKNVFFAGALAVVCVLLPAAAEERLLTPASSWSLALAFLYVVVLALTRSIFFDLKETQSDQFAGRETIPVLIGSGRTKALVAAVTAICATAFIGLTALGLVPPVTLLHLLALAFTATTLWLYHARRLARGTAFEFMVDSSFYVPALIALIA